MFSDLDASIYTAFKPILKIYIIIGCGYWLGHANMLTTQTCKHISGLAVYVLLPSLIFSKIVTNIGIEDIKQVGIIVLVSVVLYFIGALMSWVVYYATNVPKSWFGGCISVGLFPNVAELPIAYISSFSVFDDAEVEKGLSYVVMFLGSYCVVQFNLGAITLIENDFEVERQEEKEKRLREQDGIDADPGGSVLSFQGNTTATLAHPTLSRVTSTQSNGSQRSNIELRQAEPENIGDMITSYSKEDLIEDQVPQWRRLVKLDPLAFLKFFVLNLKRPMSLAMLISLLCALIPWLRALFVNIDQVQYPNAPDSEPALSFLLDLAMYLANACVPMGILVLGSTLSRLKLRGTPMEFWYTPIAITICRLVILPIIGILFTDRLHAIGWFDGDRILHFVCAISWGLPCATSLIYLTAACADQDGLQIRYLAVCFVTQYAILCVSLPILATWTIMKSLSPA